MKMVILLALVLVSCQKKGAAIETTNSMDDYSLQKLFEVDGCTVYRFYDSLRHHYFTDCKGSISSHYTCGKNCTREESINTTTGEEK